jgi:hypothetical protein
MSLAEHFNCGNIKGASLPTLALVLLPLVLR